MEGGTGRNFQQSATAKRKGHAHEVIENHFRPRFMVHMVQSAKDGTLNLFLGLVLNLLSVKLNANS